MDRATKNQGDLSAPAPRRTTRMTKPLFNASAIHEGNNIGGNFVFSREFFSLRDRYVFFDLIFMDELYLN